MRKRKPGSMKNGLWRPVYKDKDGIKREQEEYWCKYYGSDGKPVRESTHETKYKPAAKYLQRCKTRVAGDLPASRDTLRSLLDLVIDNYKTKGKRSAKLAKARIQNHILKWDFFSSCKASEVTTERGRQYVKWRQSQPGKHSNGTINRELALIKFAFTLGHREESPRITFKPYMEMLPEAKPRQGFFEDTEFEKVVKLLPAHYRSFMWFLKITSWRIDEARNLTCDKVDLDRRWIHLGFSKNGEPRLFPLNIDELENLIINQIISADEIEKKNKIKVPYVFHMPDGRKIGDLRKAWTSACEKAGLQITERPRRNAAGDLILYARGPNKGKPKMVKTAVAIPHDLRRTGIRNFRRRGLMEEVSMKLSGHKTASVFKRYNIVDERDLIAAGETLNATVKVSGQSKAN